MEEIIKQTYQHMGDAQSKEIYANRLLYNLTGDKLYMRAVFQEDADALLCAVSKCQAREKIIFGAGCQGQKTKAFFEDIDWDYFADTYAEKGRSVCGLPVLSFEELATQHKDAFVVISSSAYHHEMERQLLEAGFNCEQIYSAGARIDALYRSQYFDLPALRPMEREIFVDGGAFDGATAQAFAQWNKNYSKIYAFEPNHQSYAICKKALSLLPRSQCFSQGLWNRTAALDFCGAGQGSHFTESGTATGEQVQTVALDDIVGNDLVTFIKMDLEGAEANALQGAERTIRRCKPRLAICAYHKASDLWELPDLLLQFRPDYTFYMRHYSLSDLETVLYAV